MKYLKSSICHVYFIIQEKFQKTPTKLWKKVQFFTQKNLPYFFSLKADNYVLTCFISVFWQPYWRCWICHRYLQTIWTLWLGSLHTRLLPEKNIQIYSEYFVSWTVWYLLQHAMTWHGITCQHSLHPEKKSFSDF